MHLTCKVNSNIKEGTRWGEILGESAIMSMESTGAKDIRVLGERARVLVASRGHRETVYERIKFAIPHRVACENFFAIFAIFAKKLFAAEFATFT